VNSELSHLEGSQRAVARLSNEERIAWIRQERWIEYPRAKRICRAALKSRTGTHVFSTLSSNLIQL